MSGIGVEVGAGAVVQAVSIAPTDSKMIILTEYTLNYD
jgi:hypothetical protein